MVLAALAKGIRRRLKFIYGERTVALKHRFEGKTIVDMSSISAPIYRNRRLPSALMEVGADYAGMPRFPGKSARGA